MKKKKKKKKAGDFLTASGRRWGRRKEKTVLFFSFSRVRFARVIVDFQKAKENDVCVKAKLTL